MIEEQYFKAQVAYDTEKVEIARLTKERRQRKQKEALKKDENDKKVNQNKKQMKK